MWCHGVTILYSLLPEMIQLKGDIYTILYTQCLVLGYRYEGDGNFQEEQICFCYTFPFITFLLFDTTFEDDKLKILLWFGFKVASNLIVFLLSGILIKMMS